MLYYVPNVVKIQAFRAEILHDDGLK